jgi:hypothetical protein
LFPIVGFKKSVFLSSVADEVFTRHDKLKLLRQVIFKIENNNCRKEILKLVT